MPLVTVVTGNVALASDLNQVINILQVPGGGTEPGKYFLRGQAYATNANMGNYMRSRSNGTTPVSVSSDTADQAASNANPQVTSNLTQYGFLIYSSGTGVVTLWQIGGNFTIQY